mgnify:CR=1 FL=1
MGTLFTRLVVELAADATDASMFPRNMRHLVVVQSFQRTISRFEPSIGL